MYIDVNIVMDIDTRTDHVDTDTYIDIGIDTASDVDQ